MLTGTNVPSATQQQGTRPLRGAGTPARLSGRQALARRLNSVLATTVLVGAATPALIGYVDARTVPTGEWIAEGAIERERAAATAAKKEHNIWHTDDLVEAGFTGCVEVQAAEQIDWLNPPTHHVVRTPPAEGYRWVVMSQTEVGARIEAFGGTETVTDDVKIVGNCYRTGGVLPKIPRFETLRQKHPYS